MDKKKLSFVDGKSQEKQNNAKNTNVIQDNMFDNDS